MMTGLNLAIPTSEYSLLSVGFNGASFSGSQQAGIALAQELIKSASPGEPSVKLKNLVLARSTVSHPLNGIVCHALDVWLSHGSLTPDEFLRVVRCGPRLSREAWVSGLNERLTDARLGGNSEVQTTSISTEPQLWISSPGAQREACLVYLEANHEKSLLKKQQAIELAQKLHRPSAQGDEGNLDVRRIVVIRSVVTDSGQSDGYRHELCAWAANRTLSASKLLKLMNYPEGVEGGEWGSVMSKLLKSKTGEAT